MRLKSLLLKFASAAVALGLAGLLAAASGLVPVAASSGHWSITGWFLHFVMQRSVATQSLGVAVPDVDLDDPALVRQGAGHFATGCAVCHGAPGRARSPAFEQMLPPPPRLSDKVADWRPRELFWIVKHGVRFSGMPPWPAAGRDDEIWAMVAFLRRLPVLDAGAYRQLAYGADRGDIRTADAFGRVLADCARCHGRDGRGRGPGPVPRLAGLEAEYLYASLQDYASGERASGIMQPVAVGLDPALRRRLADHYATLPAPARPQPSFPDRLLAEGQRLATAGEPRHGIPPCGHCHGPQAVADNPRFPTLDGQYADYLSRQLHLWAKRARGGDYAVIMNTAAHRLRPEQIVAAAAYYAGGGRAKRQAGR